MEEELLTLKEACKVFKCGYYTMKNLINQKKILTVVLSKRKLIPRSELNRYVRNQLVIPNLIDEVCRDFYPAYANK